MIHGTGGSSVGFSPLLDRLTDEFVVHCLDLPGFGKSPAPRAWRGVSSTEDIDELYCRCLVSYLAEQDNKVVSLVAHSFGGYIAAKFIDKHPEMIASLILVNSAGIFPTLGRTGAYWALFFKSSIPQSLLRALGPVAAATFFRAYYYLYISTPPSPFATYYLKLLSCPDAFADTFVGRFIHIGLLRGSSYWKEPTLRILLKTRVPLGFVHGGSDDIIPVHQARAFLAICGAQVPLCVVHGAGHAPYVDRPDAFCEAVLRVHRQVRAPGPEGTAVADKFHESDLLRFKSSYSLSATSKSIDDMYCWLVSMMGQLTEEQEKEEDKKEEEEIRKKYGTEWSI